jgi:hypothetical protein
MNLKEFLKVVGGDECNIIEIATELEALEAVKQDGDALQYVKKSVFVS